MLCKNQSLTLLITIILVAILNVAQAGPDNIASKATATSSSSLNDNTKSSSVIDGVIKISGQGEWASKSGMTFWGAIIPPLMGWMADITSVAASLLILVAEIAFILLVSLTTKRAT